MRRFIAIPVYRDVRGVTRWHSTLQSAIHTGLAVVSFASSARVYKCVTGIVMTALAKD